MFVPRQAEAERASLEEVSALREIFSAQKLSVRHTSTSRDDDNTRIISELVEVLLLVVISLN